MSKRGQLSCDIKKGSIILWCRKGVNYLVMSKRGQLSCDVQKKPFLWKRRRGWISDGPYGHDQVICLPRMNSFGGGKHSCHPFRRLAILRSLVGWLLPLLKTNEGRVRGDHQPARSYLAISSLIVSRPSSYMGGDIRARKPTYDDHRCLCLRVCLCFIKDAMWGPANPS